MEPKQKFGKVQHDQQPTNLKQLRKAIVSECMQNFGLTNVIQGMVYRAQQCIQIQLRSFC